MEDILLQAVVSEAGLVTILVEGGDVESLTDCATVVDALDEAFRLYPGRAVVTMEHNRNGLRWQQGFYRLADEPEMYYFHDPSTRRNDECFDREHLLQHDAEIKKDIMNAAKRAAQR